MLKVSSAIAVLSLCSFAGFSLGGIFYNEAQFLESVQVEYANTFDDVVPGTASSMEFSQGAFSYTITAAGPGGGILSVRDGELSTTDYRDGILITFTGADVNAVGGHVWATDGLGGLRGGYISLELDDGTSELFSATSPENFQGLSTTSAIRSIFIEMPNGSNRGEVEQLWVTMSSLYIGQVVPAPGSVAMLCFAGLGVSRRRR